MVENVDCVWLYNVLTNKKRISLSHENNLALINHKLKNVSYRPTTSLCKALQESFAR